MRRFFIYTFALFITLANVGCTKSLRVTFPTSGAYGDNILAMPSNSMLDASTTYSMTAELGKKADIRVVMTNLSTNNSVWFYSFNNGWTVTPYTGNTQEFTSDLDGTIDLQFTLIPGPGTVSIDIYENSSTVTETKLFTWQ